MALVKYPGGKFGGRSGVKNISMLTSPKKHHYIIKAGDSRATRTLVINVNGPVKEELKEGILLVGKMMWGVLQAYEFF